MKYTVKQLAKLSGTTVRTLHWYDEVGLLKPAYYGQNGYRYYEEEQLLQLQQILFFRELGFKLDDIRKVLSNSDFKTIRALKAHKRMLEESFDRTAQLIETVTKTIMHLEGKQKMADKEFYAGFDKEKQQEYERYLVEYKGTIAEDLIAESKRRTVDWTEEDYKRVQKEGDAIYQKVADLMSDEKSARDDEVQALIAEHFKMMAYFYDADQEVYTGLASLYCEHPDFRKYFDRFDPKLCEFLAEAMRVWAHHNL